MPVIGQTEKTITEQKVVDIDISTKVFDFNSLFINPNGKIATIQVEYLQSNKVAATREISIVGDEFKLYTEQNPTTAPLFLEAVRATRKAWIAVLQAKGELPPGTITDTWPLPSP